MSAREQWKMIHVLNTSAKPKLNSDELAQLNIDCYNDTIGVLINDGIVEEDTNDKTYSLSLAAKNMINKFIVSNGERDKTDMYVDQPSCFVIMPFNEPWSDDVYKNFIKPAVEEVGLKCIRGDEIERTGQLTSNIFKTIQRIGLIIAEISVPNPNVYYELGIVDAFGKDTLVLYDPDKNSQIPADKEGIHYIKYTQNNLAEAKANLKKALQNLTDKYKLFATPLFCKV